MPCFAEAVAGVEVGDVDEVEEDGGDVHGWVVGEVVGVDLEGPGGEAEVGGGVERSTMENVSFGGWSKRGGRVVLGAVPLG